VRIVEVVGVVGVVSIVAAIARAEAEVAEVAEVAEIAVGELGLKLRVWWRGSALLNSQSSILLIVARAERGGNDSNREKE
jgi:hypothetical protein